MSIPIVLKEQNNLETMYIFEDLSLYNKAIRLSAIIELTVKDFPKSTFYFVNRFLRAVESIPENIAKAHKKGEESNRKNYYWRVRGSIQECFGMMEIASRQGFISPNLRDTLRIQLDDMNQIIQEAIRNESHPALEPSLLQKNSPSHN